MGVALFVIWLLAIISSFAGKFRLDALLVLTFVTIMAVALS